MIDIKKDECPSCFHRLNAVIDPDADEGNEHHPKTNDGGICFHCGAIIGFDENLNLRAWVDKDLEALTPHQREGLLAMSKKVKAYWRKQGINYDNQRGR